MYVIHWKEEHAKFIKKSHYKLIINGLTESHVINRKRIKRIQSKEYIFLGLFKFLYRHELILPVRKKPHKKSIRNSYEMLHIMPFSVLLHLSFIKPTYQIKRTISGYMTLFIYKITI